MRLLKRLDFIIDGGIPPHSSILISGPPGCGKSVIVRQMVVETLSEGKRCIYIAPEAEIVEIKEKRKICEIDIIEFMKMDMLSFIPISEQSRLTDIGIRISEASAKMNPTLIVLDSLTQASMGIEHDTILKAVELLCRKVNSMKSDILFTWISTSITEDLTLRLETLVDGVLEFKVEREDEVLRALRVYKMEGSNHDTRWHHFTIDGLGLDFGMKEEEDKSREELLSSLGIEEPDETFIKRILEREELSHLLGKEHRKPHTPEFEEVMLEVKKARTIDVEKDFARINKDIRERLGVEEGDQIQITGKNSITCEVKVAWREDAGKDIIRLNKKLRKKLGVEDSDKVLIKRG
jgi:KaiC/GvpD/RAD55 family RecA-like ATPase